MKRAKTILATSALFLAVALPGWAQTKQLPTQTVTISGTIETVDPVKRAMNIRTPDGKFVAVNVPESIPRFDQFKVGDNISATYNNNVIVRLKPPGEPAVDTIDTSQTNQAASGTHSVVRRMTANVIGIDQAASSISFEAANGWKYSRRVADPEVFSQVKVGDRVDITWNTDLTVMLVPKG